MSMNNKHIWAVKVCNVGKRDQTDISLDLLKKMSQLYNNKNNLYNYAMTQCCYVIHPKFRVAI